MKIRLLVFLILIIVFTLFGCTGVYRVTSTPSKAKVYHKGYMVGETPYKCSAFSIGYDKIQVVWDDGTRSSFKGLKGDNPFWINDFSLHFNKSDYETKQDKTFVQNYKIPINLGNIKSNINKQSDLTNTTWEMQRDNKDDSIITFLENGLFEYKNLKSGLTYGDSNEVWKLKDSYITISYNDDYLVASGELNTSGTFMEGTYENEVGLKGEWTAKLISGSAISLNHLEKQLSLDDHSFQKQKFPPDLYIEHLEFYEPTFNKALDGLESGSIQFDLVNKGRGTAYDIDINITPLTSSQNLTFKNKYEIDEIGKKDSKKVTIPISADINVKDLSREFRIEVSESNGFDAEPAKISFETLAFAAPDLRIEQIAIDDNEDAEGEGYSYGNGNSIIEPNESIEVTAYVQNFGEGNANDVEAEVLLATDNRDITYPDEGKTFDLGTIESGDYKKVEFYFYTSRRYDEENIPLSIDLTEGTGKFGKKIDLGLKLDKRTKNIIDIQVAKIDTKKNFKMKTLENVIALPDVDRDIPRTNIDGKNTLAVIIGIEDYKNAPAVDFASNDARIFYQYAQSIFGIPERNIYMRINDGATSGEFNKVFADDGWIARRVSKGKTDVLIYYSGHGAPDPKSEKGYLIPYDIDPNYISTAISLDEIYTSLSKLEAKSVTIFLDACFSGESRSEEMLIAGVRPLSIEIKNPILLSENMSVITASSGNQYSVAYPDKQHGLFTYYLLKGLKGEAKQNDNILTIGELFEYVENKVALQAGYLDKEQNPTFVGGNRNKIIINY